MRELERMQQQTLAVQSQLSQNMRLADSLGGGSSGGARGDGYSGMSSQSMMPSGAGGYSSSTAAAYGSSQSGGGGYVPGVACVRYYVVAVSLL